MRPDPARLPRLRPPPARLVAVAVLAATAGLLVHRTTSAAEDVTARLGATSTVAVARHELAPGDEVGPGDVVLVPRPVAHLPDGAVTDDPSGRTVAEGIEGGEVVVSRRLSGEGRTGPTALVPEGWRALAVPVVDAPVPARPGDRVDVVASFDPSLVDRDPSVVVAAGAEVVAVGEDAVSVAVPAERVTDVAFALTNGVVTLALLP
jgi:Flp pilus assembly protein CpaB